MPRDGPHPLALFSLVPGNERAESVLRHPENVHLVSKFANSENIPLYGLDIGFHIGSKSRYTLATIGRVGDIKVEGSGISRIQCSFEIHDGEENEIMLQDRSSNRTTQFLGNTAKSFEPGRPHRRVVIDPGVNRELGFGGAACNLYQFRIFWHSRRELNIQLLLEDREDNPRQSRTVLDSQPTAVPSGPVTRIHTPGGCAQFRYSRREMLGSGTFGEVWKAADIDTGNHFAVKIVKRPSLQSYSWVVLKREVETLSRISHRNIIEYRAAQWDEDNLHIIMDLKPGNVEGLVRDDTFLRNNSLPRPFLHQMLQALDYLAFNGIIHRDVKPENILYTPLLSSGYEYQLADFGLANAVADARTYAGTAVYMAPELEHSLQQPQTPKMDVWSLFVTLIYALDVADFRRKPLQTVQQRIKATQEAASTGMLRPLKGMAEIDPSKRASAADMLDQVFAGEGRTTPRDRISVAAISTTGMRQRPRPLKQPVESGGPVVTEKTARGTAESIQQRQRQKKQRSRRESSIAARRRQAKQEHLLPRAPAHDVDAIQKGAGQEGPKLPGAFPLHQASLSKEEFCFT